MDNKEIKNSCQTYFEKVKNVAKFKMKLKETMNLLNNNLNNSVVDNKVQISEKRLSLNATPSNNENTKELTSSKLFHVNDSKSNQYESNNNLFQNYNNYSSNVSNVLQLSNNMDKTLLTENLNEKIALIKNSKNFKNSNEETYEKRPILEFYKAYCSELENTIEDLIENMNIKNEKLKHYEKLQTENLDLKRKIKMFTKILSISQTELKSCEDEICQANILKLCDLKHNYDNIIKNKNIAKLNNLLQYEN